VAFSAAEKQARYRRRRAVKRESNGFSVTVFRRECDEYGWSDLYQEVEAMAIDVANAGGDGALLLSRLAFLLHGLPALREGLMEMEIDGQSI
jgi:hypothetical protein